MKKKIISILAVSLAALLPTVSFASSLHFQIDTTGQLAGGVVSYYSLNGNSNDIWGSGNGTDSGMSYSTSCGIIPQGGCFSGSSYVALPASSSYTPSHFTISLWFKTSSTGRMEMFTDYDGTGHGYMVQIGWNGSTGAAGVVDAETFSAGSLSADVHSATAYDDGNWHNVVATFSGTTLTLYVDGTSVGNTGGAISYGSQAPWIGGGGWSGLQLPFMGDIDEVYFGNTAVGATAVTDLYNGGAADPLVSTQSGPATQPGITIEQPAQSPVYPLSLGFIGGAVAFIVGKIIA